MKAPVLVFLSGAGSTGKTSVIEAVKTMGTVFGRKIVSMPSITRSVYAELGITTEKAATEMSIEDQKRLQSAINAKYYQSALEFLTENQDADLVMIDRSPYDHISYYLHGMAFHVSATEVLEKVKHADAWLLSLTDHCRRMSIVHFPFPEPWHKEPEGASSDGFRYDASGKNLMWALLLENLLGRAIVSLEDKTRNQSNNITIMGFPRKGMTVDARARYILEETLRTTFP